jgi:hypothetical protein
VRETCPCGCQQLRDQPLRRLRAAEPKQVVVRPTEAVTGGGEAPGFARKVVGVADSGEENRTIAADDLWMIMAAERNNPLHLEAGLACCPARASRD